jgi:large subunit ribosomal protein L3
MTPTLLGTKVGMTSIVVDGGRVESVTVIKAGPCVVLQVKTKETDAYDAVQLGFDDVKPHRSTRAMIGHAGKAGTGPKRFVREARLDAPADVAPGDVLTVNSFAEGVEYVDVTGTTKGRGYQGPMKRHGFGGMGASHGTERKHRSSGGIGGHAPRGTGQSVKKGKRMAGHMGVDRVTVPSLKLIRVDEEHDLLVIRGSIPGANGSSVVIRKSKKRG